MHVHNKSLYYIINSGVRLEIIETMIKALNGRLHYMDTILIYNIYLSRLLVISS